MRQRLLVVCTMLIFGTLSLLAKPNFTGTWKLNASKSDFGQMPAPDSMTQTITHSDPNLTVAVKMSSERGEFEMENKYTTDGKECVNQWGPGEIKSTLKYEGETLVIVSKGQFGDSEFTMTDKWTVSEDGKVLTIMRHFESQMGEGDQKLVLEKQ
ncbi:MAG TPA: hypothetical protein PLA43_08805 [Bryobacteraceae bacterium]|nr:hypothetical protein [Bryobacteraceae bacterium]HOL72910.1 hypothetical protein [Bryobacteraceae bacterium]HOQ44947.1 hypothetical protein [Bryobacteraceae bacterium]HPU72043.1 hypothetical protein [Bryobacteraceae bacterium]